MNFSDFQTDDPFNPHSEYVVANWPRRDDFDWQEVSKGRDIPKQLGAPWHFNHHPA